MDKDGTVTVTIKAELDHIRFAVTDTGPGVPPERIVRLFEPFSTTKSDGMGLGLTICRSIVEAHGGKIWYETAPSGAATFVFIIPQYTEEIDNAL